MMKSKKRMSTAQTWFGWVISTAPAVKNKVDLVAGVAGVRRDGAWTATDDFYPHAPHQRSYMPTADRHRIPIANPSSTVRARAHDLTR
jgi:hypothetical protein